MQIKEHPAARVANMKPVTTVRGGMGAHPLKMGDYETRLSVAAPSNSPKGSKSPVCGITLGPLVPYQLGWEIGTKLSIKYDQNSLYLYPDINGPWRSHVTSKNRDGSRVIQKVTFSARQGMPFADIDSRVSSRSVTWQAYDNGLLIDLPQV